MIDKEELLNLLTEEDIIKIMMDNGSEYPKPDRNGNLYFTTICHGGDKHKLHYFKDSNLFTCYTNCGSMSLFDVLMNANNWEFKEAFKYILKFKNIKDTYSKGKGLQVSNVEITDLEFLDKHLYTHKKQTINLPAFDKHILNIFDSYFPDAWVKEGILPEIMKYYGVKFYFSQFKGIIPHLDINGNLVGIKARNFLEHEVKAGKKYIPITIQGLTYRYPNNFNLYGLYQNKENIRMRKKAIIFESEKSIWRYASIYGQENNIALASLGMHLCLYQRDLLLDLDVNEVVIAYDMQYELEYIINAEDKSTKKYKEYINYIKNLLKIAKMFMNYCTVSLMLCWDKRLDYKDSPIDKGKEVFEELYKERYIVDNIEELEEWVNGEI